ncbi:MAG TPA: hypothetical protein VGR48_13405, partial [Terriglobales bacterium]|nr:hypothetical protein [Terriglobales bacterium]
MDEPGNPPTSPPSPGSNDVATSEPQPPSPVQRIFVGTQGLRAGWRFLIYVALGAVCFFAFGFLLQSFPARRPGFNAWTTLVQEIASFLAALIPAVILG